MTKVQCPAKKSKPCPPDKPACFSVDHVGCVLSTTTKPARGAKLRDDEGRTKRWTVVSTPTDLERIDAVVKSTKSRSRNDLVLRILREALDHYDAVGELP